MLVQGRPVQRSAAVFEFEQREQQVFFRREGVTQLLHRCRLGQSDET
jgi:hypothetical protein